MSIPPRLHKKEDPKQKIRHFILRNHCTLFAIGIALAIMLFTTVCFAWVPPTESGTFYNHMGDMA